MGKKNIVIICFKYPPVYSGYGKQLKSVLEKILMNNDNFHFTVLTAYKESSYTSKDIDVIPLLNSKNIKYDIFRFSRRVLSWLSFNRKNIDIIHCIKAGPEAVVANLISKIFKIPLLVKIAQDELSARELKNGNFIKKIIRKTRHKFLGTADHFIAISDEIEENIRNNKSKKSKIHKIPNGVDTERFYEVSSKSEEKKEIRRKLGFPKDEIIILYIGAINKRKGIPEFLKSLELIKDDFPTRVILCGPILEDIGFEHIINKFNKSNKNTIIDYQGKVDNPESYMQSSDIFILPSHSEGLPNVLLEAGSIGLPLITTNIGGSNEIVIDNYNGYIIPIDNESGIAKALNRLIASSKLRKKYGTNSRELIVNKYSLDTVAYKYIELYNMLTENS